MNSADGQSEVLELSVDETNRLRKELGLAPLRQGGARSTTSKISHASTTIAPPVPASGGGGCGTTIKAPGVEEDGEAVLEMSVDETNRLRANLGLAPLRLNAAVSSSSKEPVYVDPTESAVAQEAHERLERARLKRSVEKGYREFDPSLAAEPVTAAATWAQQMLHPGSKEGRPDDVDQNKIDSSKKRKKKAKRSKQTVGDATTAAYDETDLHGLAVAHSLRDFGQDSTTILTLQDAPLVDTAKKSLNENEVQLENINLTEARKVEHGLREKRKVEMGLGRTNGYAGFDDDEFEELGGTQGPSRMARGGSHQQTNNDGNVAATAAASVKVKGFRIGTAASASATDGAHDDDDDDMMSGRTKALFANQAISLDTRPDVIAADFMTNEEDEQMRSKKKDKKFKKSKKDKKRKKRSRTVLGEDSDEDDPAPQQSSLLEALEETAVHVKKKDDPMVPSAPSSDALAAKPAVIDKRDRYNMIMAKGNQRARKAFDPIRSGESSSYMDDEEPDDAFLQAALAQARRLKRLKEMQQVGAMAVADSLKNQPKAPAVPSSGVGGDVQVFETDETSEFTRALRARSAQSSRTAAKKKLDNPDKVESSRETVVEDVEMTDAGNEKVDLHELSKDIKDDVLPTASAHRLGRGVGSVLEMLKSDLTQKHAGKEILRGRAKDERTYEDYEPLNLGEVVRIDERTATKADRELAKREIKLEYRDKHGRLLTRKEAYRELCYKFHGHGSGKRKEEKKLQQIAREQAEARLVQESATMGALQATQKATGKAFVIHKAGK